ncbi:leucyl aminopeptidase [Caulobacter sp. CCUG 60055]|uniref:leucyl aminopeptidase family protein n=1 Tax=Caulobacter sp. CCUG 60055 TaxID=2100090 RepID=UPI001FA7BFFC|nr:leucyl aminopeptidase family protein [Caulobacter sp. CCUG 60055]MCI3181346.1 leucyl aminopeptidase [Caulobacter sp. CCUG 60055]
MYNLVDPRADATPLVTVAADDYPRWLDAAPETARRWLTRTGFVDPVPGAFAFLPEDADGDPRVLGVLDGGGTPGWATAALAATLPPGVYAMTEAWPPAVATRLALGWALAAYRFDRYRPAGSVRAAARLVWPSGADRAEVERIAGATFMARDLINTPAEDMGPAELAAAALALAAETGGEGRLVVGDELLGQGYPMIHAVGRASPRAPRLIDLRWGDPAAPRLTLVGKGVCFDTGGLDIKSEEAMRGMKRDMGGAAVVLALARALVAAATPVRLRVLIPAVDNAVSGDAIRPLDVVRTRSGRTVEISDTDAEGRLILCEAISEALDEAPDLLVDCATLTGAARMALGTEIQAVFCEDDGLAAGLVAAGEAVDDPLWRLPLWRPYRKLLDSKVADLQNMASTLLGGAIAAAVFLAEFVPAGTPWIHLDINAANADARPGRPEGGEATGLRALYAFLRARYG